MSFTLGPRRATYMDISAAAPQPAPLDAPGVSHFEFLDLLYRSMCALLYNYVPMSGHPGGSISSGRIVSCLLFETADYDLSSPDREDADVVSYTAGHKAMGLYSMWALRDEIACLASPGLLPSDRRLRLRMEDLLGFRRNPATQTPLFLRYNARALDGHPTPATPFVRLSTGASGVGLAGSIGLALGARETYGPGAPRIHMLEGEGGLTPGRVAEALAAASASGLDNLVLHVDWNQASIDSNRVCREDGQPGDYVQWNPMELLYLHDWNVVYVAEGHDFQQILAGQRAAAGLSNGQPTAVVYRTMKGWRYGMSGAASHGMGHKLCSDGFYEAMSQLTGPESLTLPVCEPGCQRCNVDAASAAAVVEQCLFEALSAVREALGRRPQTAGYFADRLAQARARLDGRGRSPRDGAPAVERVYELARRSMRQVPTELALRPGAVTTLREELGKVMNFYNKESGGAFFAAAADLLGSTSLNMAGAGFGPGFWHATRNPSARLLSAGGICEDAMSGILSGLSAFGHHIGAGSSYGAFLAPLGHIAARLHCIGLQARRSVTQEPYRPMVLVCAHTGLKTGEDGPTHADPQPLQLLQENFPRGTAITLTPWDPQEVWPLFAAALARRPALIAPYLTRPAETVLDRAVLGLAPPEASVDGIYLLKAPRGAGDVTIVLQESAVTYQFVSGALPMLERDGIDARVYYVSSAELFDLLPDQDQQRIFPEERANEAMGITGFTLPTMFRWVCSALGRSFTLHPYRDGRFLGSGQGWMVLREAGLDARSQYEAVRKYMDSRTRAARSRMAVRE